MQSFSMNSAARPFFLPRPSSVPNSTSPLLYDIHHTNNIVDEYGDVMDDVDEYSLLRPDIDDNPVRVKRADTMDPKARGKTRRTISMSASTANKRSSPSQSGWRGKSGGSLLAKIFRSKGKTRNESNENEQVQKTSSPPTRQASHSRVFRTRSSPTQRNTQTVTRKPRSRRFQFTRDRKKNIINSDKQDSRAPTFIDRVDEKSMPTGLAGFGSMFSEVSAASCLNDETAEPANLDHTPMRLHRSVNVAPNQRDGRESGSLQCLGFSMTMQTLDIAPLSIVDTVQTVDIQPKPSRSQSMTIERSVLRAKDVDVQLKVSRSDKGLGKVLRFEDDDGTDRQVSSTIARNGPSAHAKVSLFEKGGNGRADSTLDDEAKPNENSVQAKASLFGNVRTEREDSTLCEGVCVPMAKLNTVQATAPLPSNGNAQKVEPGPIQMNEGTAKKNSVQSKASLFDKNNDHSGSSLGEMCGVPLKENGVLARALIFEEDTALTDEIVRVSSRKNGIQARASLFEKTSGNQSTLPVIEYSPVKKLEVERKLLSRGETSIQAGRSKQVDVPVNDVKVSTSGNEKNIDSPTINASASKEKADAALEASVLPKAPVLPRANLSAIEKVKGNKELFSGKKIDIEIEKDDVQSKPVTADVTNVIEKGPLFEKEDAPLIAPVVREVGVLAKASLFENPGTLKGTIPEKKEETIKKDPAVIKANIGVKVPPSERSLGTETSQSNKMKFEMNRAPSENVDEHGLVSRSINFGMRTKPTQYGIVDVRALVSRFEEEDVTVARSQSSKISVRAMASRFEHCKEQTKPARSKTWNVLAKPSHLKNRTDELKPCTSANVTNKSRIEEHDCDLENEKTVIVDVLSNLSEVVGRDERMEQSESDPVDVVSNISVIEKKVDDEGKQSENESVNIVLPNGIDKDQDVKPSVIIPVSELEKRDEEEPSQSVMPTQENILESERTNQMNNIQCLIPSENCASTLAEKEEASINVVKLVAKMSSSGSIEPVDMESVDDSVETPNLSRACSPIRREIFKPLSPALRTVEAHELVTLKLSPKCSQRRTGNELLKPVALGEAGPPPVDVAKIINEYLSAPKSLTSPSARNQLPAPKASKPSNRRFLSISTPRRTVSYAGTIHKPHAIHLKHLMERSLPVNVDEECTPGKKIDIVHGSSPLVVAKSASKQGIEALELHNSSPSISDTEVQDDELSTTSYQSSKPRTSIDESEAHRFSSGASDNERDDDDIATTPPTITRRRRSCEESKIRCSSPTVLNLSTGVSASSPQAITWRCDSSRGNLTSLVAPKTCALPAHYEAEPSPEDGLSALSSDISYENPSTGIVEQVITALSRAHSLLDNRAVRRAHMCSDFDLLYSVRRGCSWECGHLCASSMISSLLLDSTMRFKLHQAGISNAPDINEVSRRIEQAWAAGFDVDGAAKYSGTLVGRRAYLGATEVAVLLISMGVPACTRAFPAKNARERRLFFDWVLAYFEGRCSNSGGCSLHQQRRQRDGARNEAGIVPLFISWPMRACLVVGAERVRTGDIRLLVIEPTAACADVLTARSVKKRVAVARRGESHPQWTSSQQYHVVYVDRMVKNEAGVSRRFASVRRTQSFSGFSMKRVSFASLKDEARE